MRTPGTAELVIILVIVVLLFGARKLPDLAKGLGSSLKIFKRELKEPEEESVSAVETPSVTGQSQTPPAAAPVTPTDPDSRPSPKE